MSRRIRWPDDAVVHRNHAGDYTVEGYHVYKGQFGKWYIEWELGQVLDYQATRLYDAIEHVLWLKEYRWA